MSYCSLEEAWGSSSLKTNSRLVNTSGQQNGVNYSLTNQSNKRVPSSNNNRNNSSIMNNQNSRTKKYKQNKINYNLINPDNSIKPMSDTFNDYSFLDSNLDDDANMYSEVPRNGNQNNVPLQMEEQDLSLINSENIQDNSPRPLNPFSDNLGSFSIEPDEVEEDEDEDDVNVVNNTLLNDVDIDDVEAENEGFQNNNLPVNNNINNADLTQKMLINILERLDEIEKKINTSKNKKNNVHDIILFIIIGIFVLFALDSVFRIGRSTV